MKIPSGIIENIQVEPVKTAIAVCEYANGTLRDFYEWGADEHEILMEAYALITVMAKEELIEFSTVLEGVDVHDVDSCIAISNFLSFVSTELARQQSSHKLASMKKKFESLVSASFAYEFTEGDVTRIRALLNELRQLLCDNDELEEQHKRRILKRLEKLQSEMQKKMSDLDHFYGLTVEGFVMRQKVGENLMPIVDRIMELTKIIWLTQSRAEDLPSESETSLIGDDAGR